jgi:hypothetical protein
LDYCHPRLEPVVFHPGDGEALGRGLASSKGCVGIWEGVPIYSVAFLWLFFSILSLLNLHSQLGSRKKESNLELGKNLGVFLVLG